MILKSIAVELENSSDRNTMVKAMNHRVFPTLSKRSGLLEVDLLDMAERNLMTVLNFGDTTSVTNEDLAAAVARAASMEGLTLDAKKINVLDLRVISNS